MFSKKTILALVFIICVVTLPVSAQETPEETNPNADTKLVSVNLLGPIFGLYTGSVEFPVSENLTVALQPEYMNFQYSLTGLILQATLEEEWESYNFNVVSYGGQVALNYFPEGVHNELFFGGYGGYAHMDIQMYDIAVSTQLIQGGARVGYRRVFDFLALTPYAQVGFGLSTTDASELYAELGIANDPALQTAIDNSFGFSYGFGVSIAIAF
ncbi:MAG: hypothetical protein ACOCVC_05105 [Spirochaeta sp.]